MERCLEFLSPPYTQIYYCASSLRNHSLFLIPHFELWNLLPTQTCLKCVVYINTVLALWPSLGLEWNVAQFFAYPNNSHVF